MGSNWHYWYSLCGHLEQPALSRDLLCIPASLPIFSRLILESSTLEMLPFLLPARVFRPLILGSTTSARRLVPSTSTSRSRSFATTIEDGAEELEGAEGEFNDPWSQFQEGDFESVGGRDGRKGGRSGPGASAGSAEVWLTGEGLQFKRPIEAKPNWLGVNTVPSGHILR